jgi:hypothetical protein
MVAVMAVIMVVMVVAMIVMLMVFMTLFAAFIPMFIPMFLAVLLMALMLRGTNVPRLVFLGPYEIHLPVARVILAAMQAPGPGVLGRNVQIQRLCQDHMRRRLLDDDRSGIDQGRRRPAIEVYTTIDTRRNLSLNGH